MHLFSLMRPIHLLNLFAFIRMNQAYLIDDFDLSVLQYSAGPAAASNWVHYGGSSGNLLTWYGPNGAHSSVNSTPCYDDTYTFAGCRTTDICSVTFPFTGSGATIYGLLNGGRGVNMSVTVDGGAPEIHTLAAVGGNYYNVLLFDVQSLPSGTHTLTMTAIDWSGSFGALQLDYIDVNQADVSTSVTTSTTLATATGTVVGTAAVTSTGTGTTSGIGTVVRTTVSTMETVPLTGMGTTTATSNATATGTETGRGSVMETATTSGLAIAPMSTTSDSTSHSTSHTGAIVGGVVGGLVAAAAIAIAIFCIKRKPAQSNETLISRPFDYNYNALTTNPTGTLLSVPGVLPQSSFTSNPNKMARPSNNTNTTILHTATDNNPSEETSDVVSSAAAGTLPPPPPSSSLRATQTDGEMQLTNEQADFVNNLYRRNIPASAIARIMERMLNGEDTGEVNEASMQAEGFDMAPPSYDHSRR